MRRRVEFGVRLQLFAADLEQFFALDQGIGIRMRAAGRHASGQYQRCREIRTDVRRQYDQCSTWLEDAMCFAQVPTRMEQVFQYRQAIHASH
jgi:hypothetical protein